MRHHATWRQGALPTCAKGETTFQTLSPRKGQTHTSLLFASPRQSLRVLPWLSKRHDASPRLTFCSGSEVGRRDHGQGHREQDSSARGTSRAPSRLQVRCHFACDALCAELYVEGGNRRRCRPPATSAAKARLGGRMRPRRGFPKLSGCE